jgi:hypothetical protein
VHGRCEAGEERGGALKNPDILKRLRKILDEEMDKCDGDEVAAMLAAVSRVEDDPLLLDDLMVAVEPFLKESP